MYAIESVFGGLRKKNVFGGGSRGETYLYSADVVYQY